MSASNQSYKYLWNRQHFGVCFSVLMNSVGVGQELVEGRGTYNWTQTIDLINQKLVICTIWKNHIDVH